MTKEKHYNFFLPQKFEIFINIVKNLRGRYVFTLYNFFFMNYLLFTDIKMYIICFLRLDFSNSFSILLSYIPIVEYVKFMLSHTHMRTCTLNKPVVHQHSHVNHFALPNTFPDLRTSGYGPAK
jgi:hypothetical protein